MNAITQIQRAESRLFRNYYHRYLDRSHSAPIWAATPSIIVETTLLLLGFPCAPYNFSRIHFLYPRHIYIYDEAEAADKPQGRPAGFSPIENVQAWMSGPYPTGLPHIHHDGLRAEVFRDVLSDKPVHPDLPAAYHFTGLEQRGDALADLLAREVYTNFYNQATTSYTRISGAFHSNNKGKTLLITNKHFAVVAVHFGLGPAWAKIGTQTEKRLADTLEAYLYALCLDQGLDAAARWFCPILVKKLYSEAATLEIKLPEPVYSPIETPLISEESVLTQEGSGIFAKLKNLFTGAAHPASRTQRFPPARKITYEGFDMPHWLVPCTSGSSCHLKDCYFQHPNEEGEYVWDQPGSFPAEPEVVVPRTTPNAQAISWAERGAAHVQELTKVMDIKLATLQRDLQRKQKADIEEYTLRAIERVVHPLEASVKRHTGQIDQLEASAKRNTCQIDQSNKDDAKIAKRLKKVDANKLMKALDSLDKMGTFDPEKAWNRSIDAIAAVKSIDERTDPGKWKDVQIQRLWKRLDEADEGRGKSILWQLSRLQARVDNLQGNDAQGNDADITDLPVDLDSHGASPSAHELWEMSETLQKSSSEASSSAKQATDAKPAQIPSPDERASPQAFSVQTVEGKEKAHTAPASPSQPDSLKVVSQAPRLVLTLGRNAAPARIYPVTEATAAQNSPPGAMVAADAGAGNHSSASTVSSSESRDTPATLQQTPTALATVVTPSAKESTVLADEEPALVSGSEESSGTKSIPAGPLQPTAAQMQAVLAQRERIDAILKQSQAKLAADRASQALAEASKAVKEAKAKEQEAAAALAAAAKLVGQHGRSSKRAKTKAKQMAKQKQQASAASEAATKTAVTETDKGAQPSAEAAPSASSQPGSDSSATRQEAAPVTSTASPATTESAKSSPNDEAAVDAQAAVLKTDPAQAKQSAAKSAKHKRILEARERNRIRQKAASARAAEERKAKAQAKAAEGEKRKKTKEAAASEPASKEEKTGQPTAATSSDTAKTVTERSGPKSASEVLPLAAGSKPANAVEATTGST